MPWKRILLFSLLFSILAGSLIYVLPGVLNPLRRDPIPSGAYIIPWMRSNPSIEALNRITPDEPPWDIDAVMATALKLSITFRIAIPNGTRAIPSTVYLGHDTDYLYIGGKFRGMYKNPTSTSEVVYTNNFAILFDVADDGVLKFPESGSLLTVALLEGADWHTRKVWYYNDAVWRDYVPETRRGVWDIAEHVYWPNAQPAFAIGNADTEYDNSTGTLIILFSRHLRRPGNSDTNALQIRHGERWVMGFLLELGYSNGYAHGGYSNGRDPYQDFVDGWPQKAYPYPNNDASWWPKLVIDLANPPPSLST